MYISTSIPNCFREVAFRGRQPFFAQTQEDYNQAIEALFSGFDKVRISMSVSIYNYLHGAVFSEQHFNCVLAFEVSPLQMSSALPQYYNPLITFVRVFYIAYTALHSIESITDIFMDLVPVQKLTYHLN